MRTSEKVGKPMSPPTFLSVPDVAKILGCSARAVWQRLYRGYLPYRRLGGRVLIPAIELREMLSRLPGRTVDEAIAAIHDIRAAKPKGGQPDSVLARAHSSIELDKPNAEK